MTLAAYLLTVISGLLIDYGWQPLAEGGHEYIIQVPEELIGTLANQEIQSYVPPDVSDIRRIRIKIGTGQLPQVSESTNPGDDNLAANKAARPEPGASRTGDKKTVANENAEPIASETRTAKYAGDLDENPDKAAGAISDDQTNNSADGFELFGLDALTLAKIGLGIAAAIILFLMWSHASLRRRYRALLQRMYDRAATV